MTLSGIAGALQVVAQLQAEVVCVRRGDGLGHLLPGHPVDAEGFRPEPDARGVAVDLDDARAAACRAPLLEAGRVGPAAARLPAVRARRGEQEHGRLEEPV